jgi:hypothetical protein
MRMKTSISSMMRIWRSVMRWGGRRATIDVKKEMAGNGTRFGR